MERLQKSILREFARLYDITYADEIAVATGINRNRVYRLLAGSEMKISEYEIFYRLVIAGQNDLKGISLMLKRMDPMANKKELEEIKKQVIRRARLRSLLV